MPVLRPLLAGALALLVMSCGGSGVKTASDGGSDAPMQIGDGAIVYNRALTAAEITARFAVR